MAQKGRPKREPRERLSSTLDGKLMDQLRQLADETDLNLNQLLDEAVTLLINKYNDTENGIPYTSIRLPSFTIDQLRFYVVSQHKNFNDFLIKLLIDTAEKEKQKFFSERTEKNTTDNRKK